MPSYILCSACPYPDSCSYLDRCAFSRLAHEWNGEQDEATFAYCIKCGVVKRRDGLNKPCPGRTAGITLRQQAEDRDIAVLARVQELRDALLALYAETADYIRINNLGDIHHNRTMQIARDVLFRSKE